MTMMATLSRNNMLLQTLFKLGGVIFFTELAIMYSLPLLLPALHQGVETFLDALMVTVISALVCQKWLPLLASPVLQNTGDEAGEQAVAWLSQISKFAIVLFSVEGAIMLLLPEQHGSLASFSDALILAVVSPPLIYIAFSALRHGSAQQEVSPREVYPYFLKLFLPSLSAMVVLGGLAYLAETRSGEEVLQREMVNHLEVIQTHLTKEVQSMFGDLTLVAHQEKLFTAPPDEAVIQHALSLFINVKPAIKELWLLEADAQPRVKATTLDDRLHFEFPAVHELPAETVFNLHVLTSMQPIFHPLGKSLDGRPTPTTSFPPLLLATPVWDQEDRIMGHAVLAFDAHDLLQQLDTIAHEAGGRLLIHDSRGTLWHDSQPDLPPLQREGDDFYLTRHWDTLSFSMGKNIRQIGQEIFTSRQQVEVVMPSIALTMVISRSHLIATLQPFLITLFSLGLTLIPLLALGNWTLALSRYRHQQAEIALAQHADQLEKIVSERTRQLVHADRLATLGTFSAGMAHEINNPNAFIASNIDFLKLYWQLAKPILLRHKEEDSSGRVFRFADEIDNVLTGIVDGSQRITKIVSSLKTYSKGGMNADMVVCRLLDPIQDALNLLQFKLKQDVAIKLDVPGDHVLICDRQQMAQVFVNLIQNAMDAMESKREGKEIRILSILTGEHYWVRCRDNGPGIPREAIEKIFDPFYTTRGKTKGTGLGLSIVHGIISDHFGQISAFNHDEGGAEFLLILPTKALFEKHFASRMTQETGRGTAHQ